MAGGAHCCRRNRCEWHSQAMGRGANLAQLLLLLGKLRWVGLAPVHLPPWDSQRLMLMHPAELHKEQQLPRHLLRHSQQLLV